MTWHARRLFIVSREQPDLYEHARAVFAGTPRIEVIYDRRLRKRRQGGSAASGSESSFVLRGDFVVPPLCEILLPPIIRAHDAGALERP